MDRPRSSGPSEAAVDDHIDPDLEEMEEEEWEREVVSSLETLREVTVEEG